jgi:hypothetical protein
MTDTCYHVICLIDKKDMWSDDKELGKMAFVERAKREGRHGFEGCANEECTEGCHYLQKYSPEGLCSDCELASFPSRFIGCPFCRRPSKLSYVCTDCGTGFSKWINNTITFSTRFEGDRRFSKSHAIEMALHTLKQQCRQLIVPFSLLHGQFGGWRGFYAGGNQWILPEKRFVIDMDSIGYTQANPEREWYGMEYDVLASVIMTTLKVHGIDIMADIQISPV